MSLKLETRNCSVLPRFLYPRAISVMPVAIFIIRTKEIGLDVAVFLELE